MVSELQDLARGLSQDPQHGEWPAGWALSQAVERLAALGDLEGIAETYGAATRASLVQESEWKAKQRAEDEEWQARRQAWRTAELSVVCEKCGAFPSAACKSSSGGRVDTHRVRKIAAGLK